MQLAPDYWEVLQRGVAALRDLAAELRRAIDARPGDPERLLALRDVSGLAMRLDDTTPADWREGWAGFAYTGQDLGVLAELIAEDAAGSPYRDDDAAATRAARAGALRELRDLLEQYDAAEHRQPGGAAEHPDPRA